MLGTSNFKSNSSLWVYGGLRSAIVFGAKLSIFWEKAWAIIILKNPQLYIHVKCVFFFSEWPIFKHKRVAWYNHKVPSLILACTLCFYNNGSIYFCLIGLIKWPRFIRWWQVQQHKSRCQWVRSSSSGAKQPEPRAGEPPHKERGIGPWGGTKNKLVEKTATVERKTWTLVFTLYTCTCVIIRKVARIGRGKHQNPARA